MRGPLLCIPTSIEHFCGKTCIESFSLGFDDISVWILIYISLIISDVNIFLHLLIMHRSAFEEARVSFTCLYVESIAIGLLLFLLTFSSSL